MDGALDVGMTTGQKSTLYSHRTPLKGVGQAADIPLKNFKVMCSTVAVLCMCRPCCLGVSIGRPSVEMILLWKRSATLPQQAVVR